VSRALDHQRQWIRDLDFLEPHWADDEFRLREQAVNIQQQISDPNNLYAMHAPVRLLMPGRMTAAFVDPHAPMSPVSPSNVVDMEIYRIGGKEELLLIEECLRRAYMGVGW
jgi:hypothetical protein